MGQDEEMSSKIGQVEEDEVLESKPSRAAYEHERHTESIWVAFKANKKAMLWCGYMLYTVIMWGYDGLSGGIVLSMIQFRMDYGHPYMGDFVIPAKWQLAFTAASTIGLLVGGPPAALITKKWGRRPCLWLGYVFTFAGVFLQYYSVGNLPMFFASKLVTGLPLGIFVTVAPTYCAEVAPLALRGLITSATNWCIVAGQLIGYAVLMQSQTLPGSKSYRTLFAVQWGFAAVAVMILPFFPESPYFYVAQGNMERARKNARRLYSSSSDIEGLLASITANLEAEREQKEASFGLCFKGQNLKRSLISVSMFFVQQNAGTTWVLGYMAYFLVLGGMAPMTAFQTTFGLTGAMLVGNMIGWGLVERIGRRPTAVYGVAILAATLIMIGVMAVIPAKNALWGQVAFMAIWSLVYQATIGSVAWTIVNEVPASRLRSHTQALATVVTGIVGTTWSFVLPYLVNPDEANLNGKAGFIFGAILACCAVPAFFYIPETKGRSFAEIDALFDAGIPMRHFKKAELSTAEDGTVIVIR